MKRTYLDTSVVNVWLFGEKTEPLRYPPVVELFERLDAGEFQGLISLYTLQEVYAFCEDNFPADEAREAAKLAFQELLNTSLEIAPMLKRLERLLHQRQFSMRDASDQPHAILAHLNACQAIVTYDERFKDIEHLINIYTPAEFLEALSTSH